MTAAAINDNSAALFCLLIFATLVVYFFLCFSRINLHSAHYFFAFPTSACLHQPPAACPGIQPVCTASAASAMSTCPYHRLQPPPAYYIFMLAVCVSVWQQHVVHSSIIAIPLSRVAAHGMSADKRSPSPRARFNALLPFASTLFLCRHFARWRFFFSCASFGYVLSRLLRQRENLISAHQLLESVGNHFSLRAPI